MLAMGCAGLVCVVVGRLQPVGTSAADASPVTGARRTSSRQEPQPSSVEVRSCAGDPGAYQRAEAYDALLVVSFGGPEAPDEVEPFLRKVLRGRDVPAARIAEVAEHYHLFGGASPINAQNRALVDALSRELDATGIDLPVYWGNRNWHPLLADELARMRDDGVHKALAFVTSAYASYSGCRQYLEDIEAARAAVGPGAPVVDKIRLFCNHPGFIDTWVDALRQALREVAAPSRVVAPSQVAAPAQVTAPAQPGLPTVLFTAHSIPQAMAANCDYVAQLTETARLIANGADMADGDWRLVWQSRSGPPSQPWLEPDVVEAMEDLPEGATVVLAPIGFVSDHIEVVYDLDTVAVAAGAARGQRVVRAATPGVHPRFVAMIGELVAERLEPSRPQLAVGRFGPSPDRCPPGCCPAPAPLR